ncbi:unnamed protein product [Merluccius merluccius]
MTSNSTGLDCPDISITYGAYAVIVSCMYFCTFPISLFLNGLAAWICVHLHSTSPFIVYLKHLVAADLLLSFTIPFMAASNLPGATVSLKAFACRYSNVIFYCCLYTSIVLMGLISLDRFFKIVRPGGKLLGQSLVVSHVTAACVWAMLFVGTAVPTILTNLNPSNTTGDQCMSMTDEAGLRPHQHVITFVKLLFWSVSVVIVVCYICITKRIIESFRKSGSNNSQGKRKAKLRVFLIVLVFFTCFMPLHIMHITFSYRETQKSVCTDQRMKVAYDVTLWLSSTNACLDPLLYVYLCKEFRAQLVAMLRKI